MDDSATLRQTLREELATRLPAPPDAALWHHLPGGRSNLCWRLPGAAQQARGAAQGPRPGPDSGSASGPDADTAAGTGTDPDRGDVVLKLFRPDAASTLFPNAPLAELSCLAALAPFDLAPRVLAAWVGAAGHCLAYRHLAGPLWSQDSAAVAHLLRRLHDLAVPVTLAGLRPVPCDPATLSGQIRAMAADLPPDLARGLRDRLAQLPLPELPPAPAPCLLHGDPVAANIVMTAQGARLIDWQCPGLGDPVHDLSVFLSPAMAHLYLGRQLSLAERRDFLAAYGAPQVTARLAALAPLLHLRMAAHCLTRAATGSARDAEAARLELSAIDRAPA